MNLDRGMYRVAKDLRADDIRRAAEDRRAFATHDVDPLTDHAAPAPRRPFFASLGRLSSLTGWLRA